MKTILVLFLTGALIMGVFTGCTGKRNLPNDSPDVEISQDVSVAEPSVQENEESPLPEETNKELAKTFKLPEAFESHRGDAEYFYPTETNPAAPYKVDPEDYAVVMYDAHSNPEMFGEYVDGMGLVTAYQAYVFGQDKDGDTVLTEAFIKLVFENEKNASFSVNHQERDDIYAVGKVAYISSAFGSAVGAEKSEILQTVYGVYAKEYGGTVYLSMPDGYEEFVE